MCNCLDGMCSKQYLGMHMYVSACLDACTSSSSM